MKNTLSLLIIPFFFTPATSYSQDTTHVYFNKDWKEISADEEYVYRRIIVTQAANECIVKDFYASDSLQMEGRYEDESLETELGKFIWYYENGSKSEEGSYSKGKRIGEWNKWYETGQLKTVKHYIDGDLDGNYIDYHENGSKSEEGSYSENHRTGTWNSWFDDGQLKSENYFVDGKPQGKFINYYEDGSLFAERFYENGELIKSNYFHEDGTPYPEDHIGDRTAEFPGGQAKMYEYLRDSMIYPKSAKERGITGKVFVQFVVWTDGSISDVKILKGIEPECDAEVVRVISSMPDWEPAMQLNKIVASKYMLPVYFKLSSVSRDDSDSKKKKKRRKR